MNGRRMNAASITLALLVAVLAVPLAVRDAAAQAQSATRSHFLSTDRDSRLPLAISPSARADERAIKFLTEHGSAFGIHDPSSQVVVSKVKEKDELGMDHVRLQQVHRGVPIRGAELMIHLQKASLVAANGKTLAVDPDLDVVPKLTDSEAASIVERILAKHLGVTDATLGTPRLEVFNRGIFDGSDRPTRLAWFVEATRIDLVEWFWIDAESGAVLLHFSQRPDALSRSIYDAQNGASLPGVLVRSEGSAPTGDPDIDGAYTFGGDTYNYFLTQHGRDSFDGAGASLIATVHYCPDLMSCPLQNAFWNGTQMIYGQGFAAADDVDGHELTHAVTQYSANLAYYMQSGALNESFSDIFGETVDLTNGKGNDGPFVRWEMGEELPIGAIRNMMNPNLFWNPGKMSDPQFACNTGNESEYNDEGGVHTNSGVPNKAYALMVDGGSFNGFQVNGIGLTKGAKIEYRALTRYLLSASDFLDDYNALKQSCSDLIGTSGITSADCTQVASALDAVEMSQPWPCAPHQPQVPPLCANGQAPTNLFFDNLENTSSGNWSITTLAGATHWSYPSGEFTYATSGVQSLEGDDLATSGDSAIAVTRSIAIPAGGTRLQFNHSYGFENDGYGTSFDGGIVEYSTDGGASWTDAGSLIVAGAAYGGTISTNDGSSLAGRSAFVGDSFGYTASQLDLASLAGRSVRFRFRIATDPGVGDLGWFIDDVRIYQCGSGPAPSPTPTPSPKPSPTPTPRPTATATATPTPTPVPTATPRPTSTAPTATPQPGGSPATFRLENGVAQPGGSVVLSLRYAANGALVTAAGFDVVFDPVKLSLVSAARGNLPSGVDVQTNAIAPGRVRLFVFGATNTTAWSDGSIAMLTFQAGTGVAAGSSTSLQLFLPGTSTSGVQVSDASGAVASAGAFGATVLFGIGGDLNGNGTIDVGDIQIIANVFLGRTAFDPVIHDLNGNGAIDVGDVQALVNLFLGRQGVAPSVTDPMTADLAEDSRKFRVRFSPRRELITTMGFDVDLRGGTLEAAELGYDWPNVQVAYNVLADGRARFLVISLDGTPIRTAGRLVVMHVSGLDRTVRLSALRPGTAIPGADGARSNGSLMIIEPSSSRLPGPRIKIG